jgi:hypothetical protein
VSRWLWRRFGYEPRDLLWLAVLVGLFLACAVTPRCARGDELGTSSLNTRNIGSSLGAGQVLIETSTGTSTNTVAWQAFPDHVHPILTVDPMGIVEIGPRWSGPPVHHSDASPWWYFPAGGVVGGAVVGAALRRRRHRASLLGCLLCGASTHGTSEHQESIREVDHMLERIQ